jgi:hypothetical protein
MDINQKANVENSSNESDPRFPSGVWIGWFKQLRKFSMQVDMTFRNGAIVATGTDEQIGKFTYTGRYSLDDGRCSWTKVYQSRPHASAQVDYNGFNEGKGIWGDWEFPELKNFAHGHGGFCLWPEGWPDPFDGGTLDEQEDLPIDFVEQDIEEYSWEDELLPVR